MGLFDKFKKKKEEERRKQEEARRKQEEAIRFNPKGKSLEWFSSEDGIKTFHEYITASNYTLEETIKQEHKRSEYSDHKLAAYISVFHKDKKLPSAYFRNLVDQITAQALEYVGTTELLVDILSAQAKPFYIDDDGDPQPLPLVFSPEEIVSLEKNPVLNFVANFACFELQDDTQGSWNDKYDLWSTVLILLGAYSTSTDVIAQNPWIFSKDTYFNEFGTVRKLKGFCKKCAELTTNEKFKEYFKTKYNECD
ncbi:MAG: hypothetical protein E7447_07610 [Ruminococcaceae bacterium]|nr:hypothetical protein [Oscillospiraceae bacterium]